MVASYIDPPPRRRAQPAGASESISKPARALDGQVKSPYWPFTRQLDFDRNRGWLKSEFQYARETAIRELVGAYHQRIKETA